MTDSTPRTLIGITASFTPQLLIRPLREATAGDAHVVVADFNQVHQTLMDVSSSFAETPDRLVVLWRIEDIFATALAEWVIEDGDPTGLLDDVRQLGALVAQAAGGGVPIVVGIPPVPELAWLDPLDTRSSARMTVLHGRIVETFLDGLGAAPVTLVDLAALVRVHGAQQAFDTRNDLMYHQPFSSEFARTLGGLVGDALSSIGRPVPKVLAVDADNTLWGGIVGEDGADGIAIGDSFPANGFRALQQGLVYQAANGALVAMVSKNNQEDVDEVFARRSGDMVLTKG